MDKHCQSFLSVFILFVWEFAVPDRRRAGALPGPLQGGPGQDDRLLAQALARRGRRKEVRGSESAKAYAVCLKKASAVVIVAAAAVDDLDAATSVVVIVAATAVVVGSTTSSPHRRNVF